MHILLQTNLYIYFEYFSYQLRQKSIKIKSVIGDNVCSVLYCDSAQIRHVLNNFLSNSLKYSERDAIIEIYVTYYGDKNENNIKFLVKDYGTGIAKSNQYAIFEPYLLLNHGDLQKGKGSGLGLAISKHLIQLHNGTIGFVSHNQFDYDNIPSGSEFYFTIPVEYNDVLIKLHDPKSISDFNKEFFIKSFSMSSDDINIKEQTEIQVITGMKKDTKSSDEAINILIVDGFDFIIFV